MSVDDSHTNTQIEWESGRQYEEFVTMWAGRVDMLIFDRV